MLKKGTPAPLGCRWSGTRGPEVGSGNRASGSGRSGSLIWTPSTQNQRGLNRKHRRFQRGNPLFQRGNARVMIIWCAV